MGAWAGGPRPRSEAHPATSFPHWASPCPSRNSFQALLRTWSCLRPGSLGVPCPPCPLCPPEDMMMRMSFHLTSRLCSRSPQHLSGTWRHTSPQAENKKVRLPREFQNNNHLQLSSHAEGVLEQKSLQKIRVCVAQNCYVSDWRGDRNSPPPLHPARGREEDALPVSCVLLGRVTLPGTALPSHTQMPTKAKKNESPELPNILGLLPCFLPLKSAFI